MARRPSSRPTRCTALILAPGPHGFRFQPPFSSRIHELLIFRHFNPPSHVEFMSLSFVGVYGCPGMGLVRRTTTVRTGFTGSHGPGPFVSDGTSCAGHLFAQKPARRGNKHSAHSCERGDCTM